MEFRTEGITLQMVPFKDKERIITMLTKELGVISVIIKHLSTKRSELFSITSPFCLSELVLYKKNSEIYQFKEAKLLNEHLFLRKDLKRLQVGSSLIKTILLSQQPQKKAEPLFFLLKTYLKHLQNSSSPSALEVSFLLKLLLHDGLIKLSPFCNHCKEKKASSLYSGESFCLSHAPDRAFPFSTEEMEKLLVLTYSRSLKEIDLVDCSKAFAEKIELLFNELI